MSEQAQLRGGRHGPASQRAARPAVEKEGSAAAEGEPAGEAGRRAGGQAGGPAVRLPQRPVRPTLGPSVGRGSWHLRWAPALMALGFFPQLSPDGNLTQPPASTPSRVAAVGPYIQSSTMPRMPPRPELLVKPAPLDGPLTVQALEGPAKMQTLPNMRTAAALQAKGDSAAASRPVPQVRVRDKIDPCSYSCLKSKILFILSGKFLKNPEYKFFSENEM